MQLSALEGKRVAILGYGREGRAAATRLSQRYPNQELDVFTGSEVLPDDMCNGGIRYYVGLPDAERLQEFDVAIRSPGISPYLPAFSNASNVRVVTGTQIWFAEHPDAVTVAITGTKGKSTTAALAAHLLQTNGKRVALGGNIGKPLLELMDEQADIWVLELSSFQIHGLQARPSIVVLLNLSPEHLDWHGNIERYYRDKLSIASGMDSSPVIINAADDNLRTHLPAVEQAIYFNSADAIHGKGGAIYDADRQLFDLHDFQLPGAHNQSNLCAALTVVKLMGFDPATAQDALKEFQSLPHHLQSLGWFDGIEFVDDSISTTPRSLIAALECYPKRFVTALVGGFDRGLEWNEFNDYAKARPVHVVITFGAAAKRIAKSLDRAPRVEQQESLEAAVEMAKQLTPEGGLILLSPGAPSFDAFKNYEERGNTFARLAASNQLFST